MSRRVIDLTCYGCGQPRRCEFCGTALAGRGRWCSRRCAGWGRWLRPHPEAPSRTEVAAEMRAAYERRRAWQERREVGA